MGYIERTDFLILHDMLKESKMTYEDMQVRSHLSQMQRVRERRVALRRNPQPPLGVDFSVLNLCKIIYIKLRDEKFFKLFIPEFANFSSLGKIKDYVIENPYSLMAVSYDLATQINCLRANDKHTIGLSANTLNQWKNNSFLRDVVRDVSVRFHFKLNERPLNYHLIANTLNISVRQP